MNPSDIWVSEKALSTRQDGDGIWICDGDGLDPFTREQQALYDASPDKYQKIQQTARVRVLHERYAQPFLRKHLPARGVVLEIGCGGGAITSLLIREGEPTVATDVSLGSLRHGKRVLEGRNVAWLQAPAQALPLPAESCDAIVSYAVLHHLPSETLKLALHEINRVLRPGGRLLAIETGSTPPWPSFWIDRLPIGRSALHARIERRWAAREARFANAGAKHPSVLPATAWSATLAAAGFSVAMTSGRLEYLPWRFKYSSKKAVVRMTMGIGDVLQKVTGAAGSYVMLVAQKDDERPGIA